MIAEVGRVLTRNGLRSESGSRSITPEHQGSGSRPLGSDEKSNRYVGRHEHEKGVTHNVLLESLRVCCDLLVDQCDLVLDREIGHDIRDVPLIHAERPARVVVSEHFVGRLDIHTCTLFEGSSAELHPTMAPLASPG